MDRSDDAVVIVGWIAVKAVATTITIATASITAAAVATTTITATWIAAVDEQAFTVVLAESIDVLLTATSITAMDRSAATGVFVESLDLAITATSIAKIAESIEIATYLFRDRNLQLNATTLLPIHNRVRKSSQLHFQCQRNIRNENGYQRLDAICEPREYFASRVDQDV